MRDLDAIEEFRRYPVLCLETFLAAQNLIMQSVRNLLGLDSEKLKRTRDKSENPSNADER